MSVCVLLYDQALLYRSSEVSFAVTWACQGFTQHDGKHDPHLPSPPLTYTLTHTLRIPLTPSTPHHRLSSVMFPVGMQTNTHTHVPPIGPAQRCKPAPIMKYRAPGERGSSSCYTSRVSRLMKEVSWCSCFHLTSQGNITLIEKQQEATEIFSIMLFCWVLS